MNEALALLTNYGPAFSIMGAAVAFGWSVFQFFSVRAREARAREFETFHRLIKELVEPPSKGADLYIDRQCAVLFELRFFPRYFPFTLRTLLALQIKWQQSAEPHPRIGAELDITIRFIEMRSSTALRRIAKKLRFWSPAEF
ncbi:MAG: hypothetical protein QM533_02335 [Cytophagales bacterium]|nr:hypothetical protein [Cytophagales bacterium]